MDAADKKEFREKVGQVVGFSQGKEKLAIKLYMNAFTVFTSLCEELLRYGPGADMDIQRILHELFTNEDIRSCYLDNFRRFKPVLEKTTRLTGVKFKEGVEADKRYLALGDVHADLKRFARADLRLATQVIPLAVETTELIQEAALTSKVSKAEQQALKDGIKDIPENVKVEVEWQIDMVFRSFRHSLEQEKNARQLA